MKIVTIEQGLLCLRFSGDDYASTLRFVKNTLEFAVLDVSAGKWRCPPTPRNLSCLTKNRWNFLGKVNDLFGVPKVKHKEFPIVKVDKSLLPKEIRDFQVTALEYVLSRKPVSLLNICMGAGKSLISSVWFKYDKEIDSGLILSPASLKTNWQRELKKWAGINAVILEGTKPKRLGKDDFYIVNYDILYAWLDELYGRFDAIVIDEAHTLAGVEARRTVATKALVDDIPNKIFLTGTPIRSNISGFFPMLNMIDPKNFKNFDRYRDRYGNPQQGWGNRIVYKGVSNAEELHELIIPFTLTMKKEDILKDLPPKNFIKLYLDVRGDKEFRAENARLIEMYKLNGDVIPQDKKLGALLRSAYIHKQDFIFEYVDAFLSEGNEKIVLGAYHREVIDAIYNRYKKIAVKLYGDCTPKAKQDAVDRFQDDPNIRVFVGNYISAGTGLTLTSAGTVALCEMHTPSSDLLQYIDRIHRIGTTFDQINVVFFIANGTIEEKIVEDINRQEEDKGLVLDGIKGNKLI